MKITAYCLGCLLILTAPGVMAQQPTTPNQPSIAPNQSWDLLRQLQAGEKLEVERKTGKKKVSGKFVSLSDTELVIERKRKNVSFMRDEVKNTWRVTPPSRWKKGAFIAIGLTVGAFFGAGIALSISLDDQRDSAAEGTAAIAALFGLPAAGALAGCALTGSGERTLIYTAP